MATTALYPTPLVPASIEPAMQALTLALLGLPFQGPTVDYSKVRIGWQQRGQPAPGVNDDVAFVRCVEADSPTNRMRDVQYVPNPADTFDPPHTELELTTFQRVWRTYWEVYGPNSFDNARRIRSGLFSQTMHDVFAVLGLNLFLVTDLSAPRRVPYFSDGQTWELVSFDAEFNEQVNETLVLNIVASVEFIIADEDGAVADFQQFAVPPPSSYVFNNQSLQGPPGPTGPQGPQGPAGSITSGGIWHEGAGAPVTIYYDGDYYLNKLTGDVYNQVTEAWTLVGNIRGEAALPSNPYHLVSAAGTNAHVIKSASGVVVEGRIYNNAQYPIFVKLYNKATAPTVGTDVPQRTIGVQAGTPDGVEIPGGLTFSTGIAIAITKQLPDSDATVIAANDCVVDISYQ